MKSGKKNIFYRSIIILLAIFSMCIPTVKNQAASKTYWYHVGGDCGYSKKKIIKKELKCSKIAVGNSKITLTGQVVRSKTKYENEKSVLLKYKKRTFKLSKNTKYYVDAWLINKDIDPYLSYDIKMSKKKALSILKKNKKYGYLVFQVKSGVITKIYIGGLLE